MADPSDAGPTAGTEERLAQLEEQVRVIAEALRVLARGLEPTPTRDADESAADARQAARRAHELLLAARL